MKNRPYSRSGASSKLSMQHVLGDSSILHVADMTKPVQVPLGKQSKHAWYSCLSQDTLVWDTVLSGDAQNPSEVVQVESIESVFLVGVQSLYITAIEQCAEHTGLIHLHLGVSGQLGAFQTLFTRQAIAVATLPIHVYSSASKETLLEMTEPR